MEFVFYEVGRRRTWTLRSERFDFKARGTPEGLESRDSWASNYLNRYIGELQVAESLDIQGLEKTTEVTISRDPPFVVVRWMMGNSHCHVAPRPSPPHRDWTLSREPPAYFDDLAIQSQLHHRFSLFGLSRDSDTQTENRAVNIQISRPDLANRIHDPSESSQNSVRPQSLAPWSDPINSPDEPPSFRVNQEAFDRIVRRSNLPSLLDPRGPRRIPNGPPPRLASDGPIHAARIPPPPTDSRPPHPADLTPAWTMPSPPEGIRFLYTEPALRIRPNPETAIPKAAVPIPPSIHPNPELNREE